MAYMEAASSHDNVYMNFHRVPTIYEHDECLIQQQWNVIVKKSLCTVLPFDLLVVPGTGLPNISLACRFIFGTVSVCVLG